MALVLLIVRPAAMALQNLLMNQAIAANLSNRIRWQNHWHVVRQSWNFFQNDFAGRISSRVMQTGPAMRESLVAMITSVWYILVYGTSTILLLASADRRLAIPVLCWFVGYLVLLRLFVPRMRDRSKTMTEMRSKLTGRIVDSYTNILTVKLFARPRDEDNYVRDTVDEHTRTFYHSLRLNTAVGISLSLLNACLTVGNGGFAIYLWTIGEIEIGMVATALALAWQLVSMSGWIAYQVTGIFENIGVVQEGMITIAQPIALDDQRRRERTRGDARRDQVRQCALRLRPRHRRDQRPEPDGRARREDRPDRPLGRRQVDAGQPAAALLRLPRRTHPDRRPGHRQRDAGIAARQHLDGDAGHLAAAPLDPRQHPLRPAATRPTPRSPMPPSWRMPTNSSPISRTGAAGAAMTRMSASAA